MRTQLIALVTSVSLIPLCMAQESGAPSASPRLISRDQIELNLAGAEHIIAIAKRKAAEMKVHVNVAVVDKGGHLLAFARMDGARPASAGTALTKAIAAATTRQATGPLRRGDAEPDLLLNLSLQNAAAAGGSKMTHLFGGVPVMIDGQLTGAVGVGGGTGEQDAEIAKAGINSLLEALEGAAKP